MHKKHKTLSETPKIVWDDFKPHSRIPGKILILLDTNNLSVRQVLHIPGIATCDICHCHLPFLASLNIAIFYVQTSYGCLKVSELYQESDYGVKIILDNVEDLKRTFTFFYEFLPCNYRRQTRYRYRKLLGQSGADLRLNNSLVGQTWGVGGVADVRFCLTVIPKHPTDGRRSLCPPWRQGDCLK